MIRFVLPTQNHRNDCLEFIQEGRQHNTAFHGTSRLEELDFNVWLDKVLRHHEGLQLDPGYVPATTFLIYDDERLIGLINIRHTLNDTLRKVGGHIGYMIRPIERCKGYAKKALKEALIYCQEVLNIDTVYVSCDVDNIASLKTIEGCGGILHRRFIDEGEWVHMYRFQFGVSCDA